MPKERRNRSISIDRSAMAERSSSSFKDWDQVRCPVCMEQPHNTVLLICSSHDKGCRHSNCLDLYRNAFHASALETGSGSPANLTCPLCRGFVSDWKVVQTARKYLRFQRGLRRAQEARQNRERQQDWRRMELQRNLGDFFSSIESSIDGWDESLGSGRWQGGTARVLSEENFSESEAYGRFQRNDEDAGDDDDDDAGHEEALDEDDSV